MGTPKLSISWEIDEECVNVTKERFPDMFHRGCFVNDNYEEVVEHIKEVDPSHQCLILVTAGTPCPDFSVVAGKTEGRHHPEGAKFKEFSDKLRELRQALPDHKFSMVAENVIMNDPSDCQFISEQLQVEPVVVDSADSCLISRPRLWWADIPWQEVREHPLTGQRLQWSQHNGYRKVKLALPQQEVGNIEMGGLQFHSDVVTGKRRIPCLTTPSPDPHGRPPPQKHKLRTTEEAKQRWLADGRQFAPWQYADHAMAWMGAEAVVIPPDLKEQLHNYPRGYTKMKGVAHRSRHRMLANSWHMSVASFILALVLQFTRTGSEAIPQGVHMTALQTVLQIGNDTMALPGPGTWYQRGQAFPPCADMWEHWSEAMAIKHSARTTPTVEPGVQATLDVYSRWWPHLNDLRTEVVREVSIMIEEWSDVTTEWFNGLAPEIQEVYTTKGTKTVTQVPVMTELLRMSGHQGADEMMRELTQGFQMTGQLEPGTGWIPRVDGRYASPISMEDFHNLNRNYVTDKLRTAKPSEHWKVMLEELISERDKGRVEGPLQAPSDWGVTLPVTEGGKPDPSPTSKAWAALCFAVVQSDKVRRCEDYRRSCHNSTVTADDCPHYSDIAAYVATIQRLQAMNIGRTLIWGQNLAGAYRQLPVRPGDDAYTILILPQGPTLWRHRATPFGAVASVWAFCRFGDCLTSLASRLLVVPTDTS